MNEEDVGIPKSEDEETLKRHQYEDAVTSSDEDHLEDNECVEVLGSLMSEDAERIVMKDASYKKNQGNEAYKEREYEAAESYYSAAIETSIQCGRDDSKLTRAVFYANRAACRVEMLSYELAIEDCTVAIELDPNYLKARLRRANCYEKTEKYREALEDAKAVAEKDPRVNNVLAMIARLEPIVREEEERMKTEMLGKLKDLGNTVLGKFGLSLDNFNAVKDPNTGSYSINFDQQKK